MHSYLHPAGPRSVPDDMPVGFGISWGYLDPDKEEFRPYLGTDCEQLEEVCVREGTGGGWR